MQWQSIHNRVSVGVQAAHCKLPRQEDKATTIPKEFLKRKEKKIIPPTSHRDVNGEKHG
jgi:hypothetical protein